MSDGRFEGKVAVITGAAGGIGRAVAHRLTSEGAAVLLADIKAEGVEQVAAELRGLGRQAVAFTFDVEDEAQIAAMIAAAVAEFGGLDVLHNNAALQTVDVMMADDAIDAMDADLWDRVLRTNLRGYVLGAKHAIPRLLERGGGVIINTASGTGLQGEVTRSAYGSSKAGIIGFTRNVATQYGKQGIRCCAVAPGLVATSAMKENMPEEFQTRYRMHHLTPYLGDPDDIAGVVAFLASDDARFITGVTVPADGGFSAHTPSFIDEAPAYGRD